MCEFRKKFNERFRISSCRLKGWDYTKPGKYFVTICTHNRLCLFGRIENDDVFLNECGNVTKGCLTAISDHYPDVTLDQFIIMPNHIHFIVNITAHHNVRENNHSPLPSGTSRTIGSIVRGFKIGVTKWCHKNTGIHRVWQRNYYEHIIRNETELNDIRQYIMDNPANWESDENNPKTLLEVK